MENVLEVINLETSFELTEGSIKVLDNINFTLKSNEILGLIGESGCGKSVTALSILQILPRNAKCNGKVLFYNGKKIINILELNSKGEEIRQIRGNEISMIFQEPAASFSPVYTIGEHMVEAITLHKNISEKLAKEKALEMLEKVKIPDPKKIIDAYPFELSGGMLQRSMIAMALLCNPKILIADEPTTALDVTIQAQILYLIKELQKEFHSSIIFITHDLAVISQMADKIAVMYLGHIVEEADVFEMFKNPLHPYTKALLDSIPKYGVRKTRLETISGVVPDPYNLPKGCRFHTRCNKFMEGLCDVQQPKVVEISENHKVKCFLYGGTNDER
ncbi:MAG TPA: ABC transporter ATP-binding protein [Defluviitoga tunisiensis]|jgi:peptide/nickel transport system ATP-binding protein|uniref:ABC transporter ATP-binding protein n=1 Tax=Defluviitoga tunisiensis TaxID=1006576 RepID=A0A0C7NRZ8_DEFTU|nr:ABC transporter ATP-binding protein [Defluviitoga tunisiensis]HOP25296.1 ABC transporter ATP-binding protein [Defluviitoga sp.]MDD3601486.1 ABC transporter ATP-binding protein [Defluviitoga tunisiensis]MDY0380258.1 ABC transporter ATP-binding protein [Defluviitoga tunisiensis]CEP78627.1 ABC transporter ATP-binding protein [Defluviitoga tunisiensis]HOK16519.1 ABC transporter ATP-binding protein [Defluviitoga tunisiensis]